MKNKKTIAFAMAAVSVAGTVVPTFAAEKSLAATESNTVNVKFTEGKKVLNGYDYDDVYETKFTEDKKDDTLKEGIEILQVVKEAKSNNDGCYLVAVDMTEEELKANKQAINEAKSNLNRIKRDIRDNLQLKENGKKVYSLEKKEIKADERSGNNALDVILTSNNENYKSIAYRFEGVVIEDKEVTKPVEAVEVSIDLTKKSGYKKLSEVKYNLEKAGDKYTVSQKEIDSDTLQVNVYTNDENKNCVAEITIDAVNRFDSKIFVSIPGKNDFNGHWAEKTIFDAMYNGRVDISNNFRPNDGITRAEFVKVINKTFGLKDKAKKEYFADVEKGQWFYDDILVAVKAGYIKGYEDGTFRPNEKISRQEAAVIISRLNNGNKDVETKLPGGDIKTDYKDDKHIAVWADESVQLLKQMGIIKGYEDGTFRPKNNITRAEAITMIKDKDLPTIDPR